MKKYKLIANPAAGTHRSRHIAAHVVELLGQRNIEFDLEFTAAPKHAAEIAVRSCKDFDAIVAIGGDGTVHEVVNGLMKVSEEKRPVLGVVPAGSGNDFAHAIAVPTKSDHALVHALGNEPSAVDLGVMTDEHGKREFFDNTTGIGFDSVVTIRSHKLPVLRGFLMYLTAVIQTILLNHNAITMQIETEEQKWEQSNLLLTMCNGPREGGGFMMAPEAKIDDGILHYAMIKKVSRPMMFRLIPEVMNGTHGRFQQVTMGSCRRMSVSADRPMYIHCDGEIYSGFGTDVRKVIFEVLPGALKVVRG
jgi:YegS/Rv2252/BmrU family lipid kinase